jgi:hypothetical protein
VSFKKIPIEKKLSGRGQRFGEKRPKIRGQTNKNSGTTDKNSGTLPLSDFAFFSVFNTKNAKSDRGSVPELLSVCPRTVAPPPI